MSDPDLGAVQEALRTTGVYVDPTMTKQVSDGTAAALAREVRGSDPAVYVVVYPLQTGDTFNGDGNQLARTLVDEGAPAGTYVVAYEAYDGAKVEAIRLGTGRDDGEDYQVSLVAREVSQTELTKPLLSVVPKIVDGTVAQAYAKIERSGSSSNPNSPGDDGGVAGPIIGLGVVVALAVAAALLLRRRHRARRRLALPRAVLRRVRNASDRQLARRAETDVLALGESIDEHDIGPSAGLDAWQAALDHYDAARRVLEHAEGSADVVGAVVLAARGADALRHADRGKPWEPQSPCYLNPLHGPATTRSRWHGATFPSCKACDRDLAGGREPDLLAVTVGDRSVHYAEADVEPWSSTGYGALDPDLVSALHGRL